MNIINKKTGELKPYKNNAKIHTQEQIDLVANSIQKFGWQQPIVIDNDNVIIIGHCRVLAAEQLGLENVPCVVASDLSEEEIKALRLADNRSNESEWDYSILDIELESILDVDMSEFGFMKIDETDADEEFDNFEDIEEKKKKITCPKCGEIIEI